MLGRSVTETLRLMLTENMLESLSFCSCQFENLELIPRGLRKNQSLKELDLSLMTPNMYLGDLKDMFSNHERLTKLRISLSTHQAWDLFRAMERLKSLTSLSLARSTITLTSMEAIMMMCVAIPSLQALAFDSDCTFHADALEFMVRMLSNQNNNLISSIQISNPDEASRGSDVINFGTLNVDMLVFELVDLQPMTLFNMLDTMAHRNPPRIKCLQLLRRVSETMEEDFQIICDHIANDSFGPTELALDIAFNDIRILMDALARNTRLKALTTVALEESESVMVAEGVARLRGLRKLAFDDECFFDEAFFVALLASVEQNTTLWTLSFASMNVPADIVNKYLPQIKYWLALNRVGRHQMMGVLTPAGLWPQILARSSKEPIGLYFILTERPDLVSSATRSRRRQDH